MSSEYLMKSSIPNKEQFHLMSHTKTTKNDTLGY